MPLRSFCAIRRRHCYLELISIENSTFLYVYNHRYRALSIIDVITSSNQRSKRIRFVLPGRFVVTSTKYRVLSNRGRCDAAVRLRRTFCLPARAHRWFPPLQDNYIGKKVLLDMELSTTSDLSRRVESVSKKLHLEIIIFKQRNRYLQESESAYNFVE